MGTIQVKLKSGEVIPMTHPDDWSTEQIESAIHDNFPDEGGDKSEIARTPFNDRPEPKPERTGFKGIKDDAIEALAHGLKGGIGFVRDIPNKLEKSGKYIEEHPATAPLHMLGQMGAEAADIAKGLINSPYNLNQYLTRKEILPEAAGKIGKALIPHLPEDIGVESALGLQSDPEKGDDLMRGITDVGSLIAPGSAATKSVTRKLTAPSKERRFQRALEKKIAQAEKEHSLSKGDLDSLKDSLRLKYSELHGEQVGELSPVGQQENVNIKQHKLEEKRPLTEIPEREVGEIPPEPDTKTIVLEKKEAAKKAREETEKALGVLDNPKLKGGAIVQKAIKDVKETSSDLYDSARRHYIDKQIKVDNSKEIKSITSDLESLKNADELAPGYGTGTAEQKALESQLNSLSQEKVNASDVFDLQRTLEKMAQDTRKKQYSGVNELEFKRLGSLADRFESHADKLARSLESVGGNDVQSMIIEANKGWKTYKDLSKNTVGRPALKKGELPSRAMIDIANSESGNEFLQALTEAYPELKKHMLAAHVGESSVNKLLKPTSLVKKYLEALPEVEDKVQGLQHAMAGIKHGETKAANVKKEYQALVKSMKDATKEQKIRQDAIKESDELKKQIKFHQDAIPKIEAKIKVAEKKGEDHAKLVSELNEHKQKIQDKNHLLKKYGNAILKLTGASSLLHKVGL